MAFNAGGAFFGIGGAFAGAAFCGGPDFFGGGVTGRFGGGSLHPGAISPPTLWILRKILELGVSSCWSFGPGSRGYGGDD